MNKKRPIVGIPTCNIELNSLSNCRVSESYIIAVHTAVNCLPLLVPCLAEPINPDEILDNIDGLFLSGSPSNVHPSHYQSVIDYPDMELDQQRDRMVLSLLRKAIARGMPILAICRGFQELNVALGGSLHQNVHEVAQRSDHNILRGSKSLDRYEIAHEVFVTPNGKLEQITSKQQFMVNSVHNQAIDQLATSLNIEAIAPDGTIEAISMNDGFVFGIQWHPEQLLQEKSSIDLFNAFGDAVRAYSKAKIQTDR